MAIRKSDVFRTAVRPRWSEADARVVLDALNASGRSVNEFARRHGLDPQRLRRWEKRLEDVDVAAEPGAVSFAPVVVTGAGQSMVVVVRAGAVAVEVVDPSAVDPRWVARLLDAVDGDEGNS